MMRKPRVYVASVSTGCDADGWIWPPPDPQSIEKTMAAIDDARMGRIGPALDRLRHMRKEQALRLARWNS